MKKALLILFVFLLGAFITQIPDLTQLYIEHVERQYTKKFCTDKGIGPDQCEFSMHYDPYAKDHPALQKISFYLILGEGPLYWVLSGRCSNEIFHNVSASPTGTGKITNRRYFFSRCSKAMQDASDLIFGDGDKAQDGEIGEDTL